MNLYLLILKTRKQPFPYDRVFGFIIRANTEEEARSFAAPESGMEDGWMSKEERQTSSVWLDASRTTCSEIASGVSGKVGVVIRDLRVAWSENCC